MISVKKGLTLPITGEPFHEMREVSSVKTVALTGLDYVGLKPKMMVRVGDSVKKGQVLFEDKRNEGVVFTSPASGTIKGVNRGEKRVLQSVVIEVAGNEAVAFDKCDPDNITGDQARKLLLESGLWPSFRTRPFSKVANPNSKPAAIFVTAMDSNPLAVNAAFVIEHNKEAFEAGLKVISKLTENSVYVCASPFPKLDIPSVDNLKLETFDGPHPAGLAGTHIHFLEPVNMARVVWTIGYQDVIAIGRLCLSGDLNRDRVVSLAGPGVTNPAVYKVPFGACLQEVSQGLLNEGELRIISGSVFYGRAATENLCYLGHFHNQISVLEEGREREFLGWKMPNFDKFSVKRSILGGWLPFKKFRFTTSTHGSPRAMVPVGCYESVTAGDYQPTFLLRYLVMQDCDRAESLGALELDEEDVGLWSFVCPGKTDYAPHLRAVLNQIEKEG